MSNSVYWNSLNKMLRNDEVEFTPAKPAIDDTSVTKLTFKCVDNLKKGIQYALTNPKVISELEFNYNNGQSPRITEIHLNRAKIFIQNGVKPEVNGLSTVLNACSDVPIDDFLLECFVLTQQKQTEYHILTDNKRKTLITTIFGSEFTEESSTYSASDSKCSAHDILCTQIIFDTADSASAIDELLINLSDCTWSPWRIATVYIQESIKTKIADSLTKERLNAANRINGNLICEEDNHKNDELVKKYGGQLICSDNNTICLMFDIPPKYLKQTTYKTFHQIPVAINFFRTAKEVIQLIKSDYDSTKKHLTSVWTENIGLFYEVAADLNSDIIWSNSIGLFDKDMPLLNNNIISKDSIRFAIMLFFC